jgi:hypothetical protein
MKLHMFLIAAFVLAAFSLAGQADYEEAELRQAEYCEMVKLWKQTKGEAGWPAFRAGEVSCEINN